MNIPCNVIRDLLPLYHDNVCSPETSALVEEHLKDCETCQEEFHKLQENSLSLPVPKKEERKAEGLAKVKKALRKKRVIVAAMAAAVTIVLCYGGYLFLHLPLMGEPIESVHSVSVEEETERLVVNLSSTYGGLNTYPLPDEEGTILVLASTYCLADPLTHFFQGTLQQVEEWGAQGYDYYLPLTMESYTQSLIKDWEKAPDIEALETIHSTTALMFPSGDYSAVYFYTGPALQVDDRNHLRNHLEDQCTLLWTAEDGVVYSP